MTERDTDILIIGGGLAGAALQLALAPHGIRTLLVEARTPATEPDRPLDTRTLALAPASTHILEMLGVWEQVAPAATPITTIHVSEQGRFGRICLEAPQKTPLGFVVEMHHLHAALMRALPENACLMPARLTALDLKTVTATVETPSETLNIRAKLVVAADGADSSARRFAGIGATVKTYQQHALIANIGLSQSHQQVAYERFTPTGPMAMLPLTQMHAALVWTLTPRDAARLRACDEKTFLRELQHAFGYRLGRFERVGERLIYPLREVRAETIAAFPLALVANAANTLHPVAGQGFNLGLRDVSMLAECIIEQGITPLMLQDWASKRRQDQHIIRGFTDGLVRLFTQSWPGLGTLRAAGLTLLDNCPPLKRELARYAQGFGGTPGKLACRIPITPEKIHE
ncbi:2-octaprenyl-6-methoxyphenol hydroxylase [Legionella geestiana]|uniref:2-octaprenyl-6-methoxyphenol hydroxylase n=1 Tax=Legionella geestiana TaxID=45065 RepID=A0A0W0TNS2_9GAMM|nr:FAD-dependent monooxygenase [Legionella geestiana]KTC97246.1 2-octaprenyl-6-methoxyphenol hydroxylase [Legionella geestiana]QBS12378.1 2-octaprenyl-6-methoxyphenyl hydroxylase [Legionella geestiana]STX55183.1 2-octaprenyl-6-methoxyphenol hydroxylase [Legionella geestiana]